MLTTSLVSQPTLFLLGAAMVICILVPIVSFAFAKKHTNLPNHSFFMGLFTYVIFGLVFASFINGPFLAGTSDLSNSILNSPLNMALYTGIVSAACTILGHIVCLKYFMAKNLDNRKISVFYGVGFAALYPVIYGFWPLLQKLLMGMALNTIGSVDGYVAKAETAEEAKQISLLLNALLKESAFNHLITVIEPLSVFIIEVCVAILVYKVIIKRTYGKLIIPAIMNVIVYILPSLYYADIITIKPVVEALCIIYTILVVVYTKKEYSALRFED